MDAHHLVPVLHGHVDQHPVAQDARVVDQDIEASVGGEGQGDETLGPLPVRDVVPVGHGLPAGSADLLDYFVGGLPRAPRPIAPSAQVVHHDQRTCGGEAERLRPADAAAGTRHHGDAALA